MLAQTRPNSTNAVAALSVVSRRIIVETITACNVGETDATFQIFQTRKNSTTFNENNAVFWNVSLPVGSSKVINVKYYLVSGQDTIGVRSSVANGITFTIDGSYES